jgi:ABC-type polysaccharide/polyol phosphate export permease
MFWTCPIFFRSEAIVEQLPIIMYVNPMSSIIMNSRTFLLDGIPPDFFWLIYDMVLAILLFIISIIAFRKFSDKLIEYS